MVFSCPCRRVAAAAVVAIVSLPMLGCGSHERVETALARSAFVSTSTASAFAPTAGATPKFFISPTPTPHTLNPVVGSSANYAAPTATTPAKMTTSSSLARAGAAGDDLRVMTFNLRVPFILDATNHWGFRKKNVIKTIEAAHPDVLGVQECVAEQADYLREHLPEYTFRGVGRGDGARQGEFAAVLYRSDKFKEIDHGYFWLSETPDVPGSKSWGAWSTRMCTWVKLQPLDGAPAFCMFNAHLDNMSGRSREMSARLMHQRIEQLASGMGVIVTGRLQHRRRHHAVQAPARGRRARRPTASLRRLPPGQPQGHVGRRHAT
jgi:endonuclease/exonuclease/phosphatase family metal-dependent hydrolase